MRKVNNLVYTHNALAHDVNKPVQKPEDPPEWCICQDFLWSILTIAHVFDQESADSISTPPAWLYIMSRS